MTTTTPNEIRKTTVINAPQSVLWDAITDSSQFGYWFGAKVDGPFEAGKRLKMVIEPTKVDEEVAKEQEAYRGIDFDVWVDEIQPQSRFSFRWQAYALEEGQDPEDAPKTLVEFLLEPEGNGTRLTIVESGFDNVPLEKRAKAFAGNEQGWTMQIQMVGRYVQMEK